MFLCVCANASVRLCVCVRECVCVCSMGSFSIWRAFTKKVHKAEVLLGTPGVLPLVVSTQGFLPGYSQGTHREELLRRARHDGVVGFRWIGRTVVRVVGRVADEVDRDDPHLRGFPLSLSHLAFPT